MTKLIPVAILALMALNVGSLPLFESNNILDVTLEGPLHLIRKDKKHKLELPFLFTVNGTVIQVQVRVRGNSRKRVCKFPPLRLNFARKDVGDTLFLGQDKLKLVTHCSRAAGATLNVVEEFVAYRIFELVSDMSVKVRLLRISYVDTDKRKGSGWQRNQSNLEYGFLIEPVTKMANRVNATPFLSKGITPSSLDAEQAAKVYIFQYMIGNTDWSLAAYESDYCCHNARLIQSDSGLYYVPYDFDLSGLVSAGYAYPHPSLKIRHVKQRLYRGYCTSPEVLKDALDQIKQLEPDIQALLMEMSESSSLDMASSRKYINSFFDAAKDENKLIEKFERQCLKAITRPMGIAP